MTNQKRVGAGVPTGGQFDSHDRTDANVALDAEDRIQAARDTVRAREALLSAKVLATQSISRYPSATTIRVAESDEHVGNWGRWAILDADGETLADEWEGNLDVHGLLGMIPCFSPKVYSEEADGTSTPVDDPRYEWLTVETTAGGARTADIDLIAANGATP